MTTFAAILTLAVVLLFYWALRIFINLRRHANKTLELAASEFDDILSSILKTPGDLPDTVLDILAGMNGTISAEGSDRVFFNMIRGKSKPAMSKGMDAKHSQLEKDINSLRPELQELLQQAVKAWLFVMCHRSIIYGPMIAYSIEAKSVQKGSLVRGNGFQLSDSLDFLPKGGMKIAA